MLPVISATISIIASGARAMLPKQHIIDDHVRRGVRSDPREDGLQQPPDGGADERPDHHAGSEDAAGSARSDRQAGREDPRERQDQHDPQRDRSQRRPERLLDPSVAGAHHLGYLDRDHADQRTADRGLEPPRQPRAGEARL
jgi:hypothetical protein